MNYIIIAIRKNIDNKSDYIYVHSDVYEDPIIFDNFNIAKETLNVLLSDNSFPLYNGRVQRIQRISNLR